MSAGDDGAFDAGLVDVLARAEDDSFWFRSRNELIISTLGRAFPGASTFLEVGCGTGFVLRGLHLARPDLVLTGAELSADGLKVARERLPDVRLLELDVLAMPFEEAFDVVGAFDVIEHVEDDARALAGLLQAVRPGGGVLLTVPQHRWLWSAFDEVAGHHRRYSRDGLFAKLERAGFVDIRLTSFVTLLLPAMLASRLRYPAGSKEFDLERSLRLPPLAERICEIAMRVERRLIEARVRLPAGGSLLAAARRPT